MATSLVSSKQDSLDAASSPAVVGPPPKKERVEESNESIRIVDRHAQTNNCLFCTKESDDQETNLEHMSSEHGLYIPEIEQLSSVETIIRYLHTVITEYNECLYCGMIKQTAEGVRRHMLDKGHCMINLEREPELLEFWEFSDSDRYDTDNEEAPNSRARRPDTAAFRDLSQDEYILPSGKVVGSKSKAREARLFSRKTALAAKEASNRTITEGSIDNTNTDIVATTKSAQSLIGPEGAIQERVISVRDARGLVGVSDQQIRSLVTVHRKMQRQQAIVRASAKWADELGGTHQKHYKQKMNLRDG